ncbi:MAG: hypothetical protein Q6363_006035 [Candidatus Njordarchaeota archaeon]
MSSEEEEMVPLTFHEVVELLRSVSEGEGIFRRATQRRIYEYAQKFLYAGKEEIDKIIKELESLGVPRKVAIQIAYILPATPEEVKPFLSQIKQMGVKIENEKEFVEKIVGLIEPIWREKASVIMSLRNVSMADLKKEQEEKGKK